jgi:hypothetical protein
MENHMAMPHGILDDMEEYTFFQKIYLHINKICQKIFLAHGYVLMNDIPDVFLLVHSKPNHTINEPFNS